MGPSEESSDGAHYNHSASGWFDSDIFKYWLAKIALPFLQKKNWKESCD